MRDASNSITVLTWARNERHIMPFFLRHYAAFADRIIVWDNGSDDGTQDIVRAYPKAELRHWETGGVFDELGHTKVKNTEYKSTGPGWKIVVDTDEFVWCGQPGMRALLTRLHERGVTVVRTLGFDMVSPGVPEDDGRTQLTDIVKEGIPSPRYNKTVVFKRCVDVQFYHGCHSLKFKGDTSNVRVTPEPLLKLLHYHWIGFDRVLSRAKWMHSVMDQAQLKMGLNVEVTDVDMQKSRFGYIWMNRGKVLP